MKLNELSPAKGSRKALTRLGRGVGSGTGKTAGRGTKGFNSRSGGGVRPDMKVDRCRCTAVCPSAGLPTSLEKTLP